MELEYNEQYKNYSLDLKTVKQNEEIEFTFKFDKPKSGEASKGDRSWMWYLYSVTMHTDEGDKDVSFFSSGFSPVEFTTMSDWLNQFSVGDKIKLKMTWVENEGKIQRTWEYLEGPEDQFAKEEEDEKTTEAPKTPIREKSVKEVVELLVANSKNKQQADEWVQETLSNSGVTDFGFMNKCVRAYQEHWS